MITIHIILSIIRLFFKFTDFLNLIKISQKCIQFIIKFGKKNQSVDDGGSVASTQYALPRWIASEILCRKNVVERGS